MTSDNSSPPSHPPPWLFMLTGMPYGIVGGFVATTLPYFTRKAGISVETIGWYGTALMLAPVLQFLYAPIIDLGPKRKHWLVIVSVIGALCLWAALMMPLPDKVGAYVSFVFAGQMISGLVGSCNGGLLASTLPNELRGQAAGYLNTGNLTGGALGAWLTLSMAENYHFSNLAIGAALAVLMIAPSLMALTIKEAERVKHTVNELFGHMIRDVWRVAKSRPGWTGILFCISPVGSAALLNYFAALAPDYHASPSMVGFINGPINGLVSAAGALAGGFLCDRINRRVMYLISGGLTAVCAIIMALSPLTPNTYAVGVTFYLLISGLCYAAFSAVVLEAIGKAGPAASTQYTLFTSAGNFAIMYVGWIDTRFHHTYGPRGLLGVDAGANVLGIILLSVMIALVYRKKAVAPPASAVA